MDQAEGLRNIIKMNRPISVPPTSTRIITVTSGKGGVGKSNTSVNLAVNLKKKGKRVMVFDADFGLANVEVMFGAIPKYNLSDVIYRGKNIREVVCTGVNDIPFISGGSGIEGLSDLTKDQIGFLIRSLAELDSMTDILIVDTAAGISASVMDFVLASPEVLLVITPEPSSLTDAYSLLKMLSNKAAFNREQTKIKVIANKAPSREEGIAMYNKIESVAKQFLNINMEFLGIIPLDDNISKAVMQQMPVSIYKPTSKSAMAFDEIADKLINYEKFDPTLGSGMARLFSRFLSRH